MLVVFDFFSRFLDVLHIQINSMILHAIFSYINVYIFTIFFTFFQNSPQVEILDGSFKNFHKNYVIII